MTVNTYLEVELDCKALIKLGNLSIQPKDQKFHVGMQEEKR